jgi:hypothetical protein
MYTTQLLVKSYLKRELTADEVRIFNMIADAASEWIDKETGRRWETVDNETRYFTGGDEFLFIDPIIDITSVEYLDVDGNVSSTYESTDYNRYPLNGGATTHLKLKHYRGFPRGEGQVKITGKWGEVDGTPSDIQFAATVLVADWLSSEDKLKSESIEGYSRTFADVQDNNPQVSKILASRKRILI